MTGKVRLTCIISASSRNHGLVSVFDCCWFSSSKLQGMPEKWGRGIYQSSPSSIHFLFSILAKGSETVHGGTSYPVPNWGYIQYSAGPYNSTFYSRTIRYYKRLSFVWSYFHFSYRVLRSGLRMVVKSAVGNAGLQCSGIPHESRKRQIIQHKK